MIMFVMLVPLEVLLSMKHNCYSNSANKVLLREDCLKLFGDVSIITSDYKLSNNLLVESVIR